LDSWVIWQVTGSHHLDLRGPHTKRTDLWLTAHPVFFRTLTVRIATISTAVKMSAIRESGDAPEPIQVLFTLHHNMNALDFAGPLEVMMNALHNISDSGKLAWYCPHES